MNPQFSKAQRAYDSMSPPERNDSTYEPHYPCDTCGKRDIQIVQRYDDYDVECCHCSRRLAINASTPEKAIELWEDIMWESQANDQDDRRQNKQ